MSHTHDEHGAPKPAADATAEHDMAGMDHAAMGHAETGHDHAATGHDMAGTDHSNMNHAGHAGSHAHMNHAGHDMAGMDHSSMDHSKMNHGAMDHAGHSGHNMAGMDHAGHAGHSGHDHSAMGHGGHGGGHMAHHVAMFRRMFWIMLIIAIPTVFASRMFANILGYSLPDWAWFGWVSPILGTVMFFWGGQPFLTGGWSELRSRKPGMMLLIALAITVAFVASWGSRLGLLDAKLDFWWELALLIVIMLFGHWIEMRSLMQTSSALDSLAALLPDEAERVEGDTTVKVSPSELQLGDLVLVRPGGSVPADGEIVSGTASMNESMITGESAAVRRGEGDRVVAGTVATDSSLRVRVTATGDDTTLAGIQKLVADAQASSSRAQLLADRAAGWLFWYALIAGIITAIVWTLVGSPDNAVVRTITVLVIACPHALGLAIPLVVSIATERAARAGILIKDRRALEAMRTVDTVLFDKTGTLTKGEPAVVDTVASAGWSAAQVRTLAAAAEAESEHPLARAVVRAAGDGPVPAATDFTSAPAVGVSATVDGKHVQVGGPNLLTQLGAAELPETAAWRGRGATILHVVVDGVVVGALALADDVRPESKDAVARLHDAGIEVVMITGDAQEVADAVAGDIGIDRVYAGVRPQDKSSNVAELQAEGKRVAMVGDGVNDAPALAKADVGIAIGAGTDVAIASAGVILAADDPRAVLSVRTLSQATYRKMVQNLWWAAGYNLISVPLAAGVLAPIGFVLPVSVGALLMSASTVVVALNAQLLRRLDLRPR